MGKDKLKRFSELSTFKNVFQPALDFYSTDHEYKGKWNKDIFCNEHPLILELGCGRGEYTTGSAQQFPENNYVGIDIKGARLWRGAKTALENNLINAAFLRIRLELIEKFFAENEAAEIWLPFPDPQQEGSRENKRLYSGFFFNKYRKIIQQNGKVHLKTDSPEVYNYTLNVLKNQKGKLLFHTDDLYSSALTDHALSIQTTYEKMFLKENKKICYLCFSLEK